jgi:transcription elongation factor GreA
LGVRKIMGKQGIVLTAEGLRKLQAELDELRSVTRKEVAERIREAKAFGDISENSEYDVAKAQQALTEGRIETLQYILQTATIASGPDHDGNVSVGARVRLRDLASGEEIEYFIVGALEADPAQFLISNQSPLGEALIGNAAGATVAVQTPSGTRNYTVLSVSE